MHVPAVRRFCCHGAACETLKRLSLSLSLSESLSLSLSLSRSLSLSLPSVSLSLSLSLLFSALFSLVLVSRSFCIPFFLFIAFGVPTSEDDDFSLRQAIGCSQL